MRSVTWMLALAALPVMAADGAGGGTPLAPLTCTVTPRVIEAGAFYDGASVKVQGTAAPGSKVILTVVGSDREERFGRKARVGFIWLSASKLRITGVPSLFLRFSAAPVAALLGQGEIVQRHLDRQSMMARMRVEPPSMDRRDDARIRSDYMALRKDEGTFSFGDSGIVMVNSGTHASYTLDLPWPKRAPPATYEVHVYEVVEGAVARETSTSLSVVRIGFSAWLADTAMNRASLYGIVAVLIGALAGFGIDRLATLLFGRKRSVVH
jgi:hypothetical protein